MLLYDAYIYIKFPNSVNWSSNIPVTMNTSGTQILVLNIILWKLKMSVLPEELVELRAGAGKVQV